MTRKVFSIQDTDKVVAKENWGRIEKIAENTWAVVSTPFDDRDFTTVCNGGIIAGKDRVVAIESYMQPKGAGWVANWAKKLTGRWPTDIVVSHFHGDHSSGAPGFYKEGEEPRLWMTSATVANVTKNRKAAAAKQKAKTEQPEYPQASKLDADKTTTIDLGGRKIKLVPRQGHTTSDISVELVDPNIIFCGDLFFNRMIPNYGDALPVKLDASAKSLTRTSETIYVPGHGPVADNDDFLLYRAFLEFVGTSARDLYTAGKSADEAAKAFKLSDKFKDWYIFSDAVVPRAINAWFKEFKNDPTIKSKR